MPVFRDEDMPRRRVGRMAATRCRHNPGMVDDPRAAAAAHTTRHLERLAPAGIDDDARGRLARIVAASDFVAATFAQQPALLAAFLADADAPAPVLPALHADAQGDWPRLLRRHRQACSARIAWRDMLGLDDVDATLAAATALAGDCMRAAFDAVEAVFAARHGRCRDANGRALSLVVFGLGKLGGGELNFSSDVDLVYAMPDGAADSDGDRPLAAEAWFARFAQQFTKLLDEVTGDGFCLRVDLRLRPFGNAGRIALPFAAMEQYFQREGRDWERYAWQKARPVAGDIAAGDAFLDALRPFVYRRYLDFGALDGLRTMKAAIAAEVARRELAEDVKRGPGGIREIEFLAQALQLIRGGREPALRVRGLRPALAALRDAGQVSAEAAGALRDAYRFLRRLENRLQMFGDAQVHAPPADAVSRLRIAQGMGFDDWAALQVALDAHRARVSHEFAQLLGGRERAPSASGDLAAYWRALPYAGDAGALAAAGFTDTDAVDAALRDLARAPGVRELSDRGRARLDRVLPVLLQAIAPAAQPLPALRRAITLLHNLMRRASYLALLDEQPAALQRLVGLTTRSAFLAERIARHPLLLDELLDARVEGALPDRAALADACAEAGARDDPEAALLALNELRQAQSFRIALAVLDGRIDAGDGTRRLAWLADGVLAAVLALARRQLRDAHGEPPGAAFAVLGYGSLGGEELGIGSDLDLVFLYDAIAPDAPTDGARPVEASRWAARLAQKVVALLGTETAGGRLYETDTRLRPDGASGLLVSTIASYADYQRARAWTWEHQALVRARCVAGDAVLCAAFDAVRTEVLGRPRDVAALRADVAGMRARMRGELDRSRDGLFDLKQGEGGLVDLEFLLQHAVLAHAADTPALLAARDTAALLSTLGDAALLPAADADALRAAHATFAARGLACTLDRRPRLLPPDDAVDAARAAVRAAFAAAGLADGDPARAGARPSPSQDVPARTAMLPATTPPGDPA